jgi:carboxyl-terminal processing protease
MSHRGLVWLSIMVVIGTMMWQLPQFMSRQDSVYRTYAPLVEVDAYIRKQYVEPVRPAKLLEGAIRGMMMELDPYSGYLTPAQYEAYIRRLSGETSGIGMSLGIKDSEIVVIAPIEGSPAYEAGIRTGDRVLSIDGVSMEERSVFDAGELLEGKPGTKVTVRIARDEGDHHRQEHVLTIIRNTFRRQLVKGVERDPDGSWNFWIDQDARIGYVRISAFFEHLLPEYVAAITKLRQGNVRGLIIDLRFNPGGLLPEAVAFVDRFVDEGEIVSTVSRHKAVHHYPATNAAPDRDLALVVLVNGASASCSEIVAGSLRDHGKAVVVGERSFGKGSVQHVIPLERSKAGMNLTVARYRLPSGHMTHRTLENEVCDQWGITPDVVVTLNEQQREKILENRPSLQAAPPNDADQEGVSFKKTLNIDRQLETAIVILREKLKNGADTAEKWPIRPEIRRSSHDLNNP